MAFANCLKELRKDKNCTQRELAEYLGYSTNIICEWENQRCEPKIETILRLADFFDVSIDYLLGRTDELGAIVPKPTAAPALAEDEAQLLSLFRGMDHAQKVRAIAYCEGLVGASASKFKA